MVRVFSAIYSADKVSCVSMWREMAQPASFDFANHFELEFAGECAPLDRGPRRYCALLRHR
jgi:hypothetical protein